jgi:hypothetical protein
MLWAAPTAGAQMLGGTVVETSTKRPMPGVTVTLVDAKAKRVAATKTDSSGTFYLDAPNPGDYSVAFTNDSTALGQTERFGLKADDFVQRAFGVEIPTRPYYLGFQVTRPATPRPGNRGPRYPTDLRDKHVNGGVLARFVIDTTGHADMTTFVALRATHDGFIQAVADALPQMLFYPGVVVTPGGETKVRQMVIMPFSFSVSR